MSRWSKHDHNHITKGPNGQEVRLNRARSARTPTTYMRKLGQRTIKRLGNGSNNSNHQRLIEVTSTTSLAAEQLNEFYDIDALELRFPDGKPTSEQSEIITCALEAVLNFQRMRMGPLGSIMSLSGNLYDIASLHIIHDFKPAEHVSPDGTITIAKLARISDIPDMQLHRVLRHAMTNRMFRETVPGDIAHTSLSVRLGHDPVVRATVGMLVEEMFPAAACLSSAIQIRTEAGSVQATNSAWALANHATRPMVEELENEDPERAAQFAAFMKYNWSMQHPLQPLIDNFDWAALGTEHIVDIGGGMGHVSIALAKAFPHLTFTVQDFAKVVESGEKLFREETVTSGELQAGLRKRVTFMAHDAFEDQPIKGAAVYLLRSVLHDWPDERCVEILRRLVPALNKGATVLVNDYVMPEPGEWGVIDERRVRSLDLTIISLFNARERETREWGRPLFEEADSRFLFKGVRPCSVNQTGLPTKKLLSIIEATWMG